MWDLNSCSSPNVSTIPHLETAAAGESLEQRGRPPAG